MSDTIVERILIVCAGSQGVIVADALRCAREAGAAASAIGFVDDTTSLRGSLIEGLPVLGTISEIAMIEHDAIVVALGDNKVRREITERLVASGERLHTVIHPSACVARSAVIREGSMVSAGACILPRAKIGRCVLLNTRSSVDHDCVIGDFAHIAPGATLGGSVTVGDETLIAVGANLASGTTVGARSVIGAGSAVVRDIGDDVRAWGVPARVIGPSRFSTNFP